MVVKKEEVDDDAMEGQGAQAGGRAAGSGKAREGVEWQQTRRRPSAQLDRATASCAYFQSASPFKRVAHLSPASSGNMSMVHCTATTQREGTAAMVMNAHGVSPPSLVLLGHHRPRTLAREAGGFGQPWCNPRPRPTSEREKRREKNVTAFHVLRI